jgi:UDP:flavonoid glycosyltransferase YjiC (YdhE family)
LSIILEKGQFNFLIFQSLQDLEDFVSKSGADGFIFFSMGSAVKADQMPQYKKKIFLKVFSQLKQQVIWKWESDSMEGEVLPKNVKLSKWLPQQDLLGHPKIKAFLTHCGGGSTEESIFHGVPIVGLPMFGDQIMNAQQAKNMGFSVELDWNDVTEDSLTKAIQEVLGNPK